MPLGRRPPAQGDAGGAPFRADPRARRQLSADRRPTSHGQRMILLLQAMFGSGKTVVAFPRIRYRRRGRAHPPDGARPIFWRRQHHAPSRARRLAVVSDLALLTGRDSHNAARRKPECPGRRLDPSRVRLMLWSQGVDSPTSPGRGRSSIASASISHGAVVHGPCGRSLVMTSTPIRARSGSRPMATRCLPSSPQRNRRPPTYRYAPPCPLPPNASREWSTASAAIAAGGARLLGVSAESRNRRKSTCQCRERFGPLRRAFSSSRQGRAADGRLEVAPRARRRWFVRYGLPLGLLSATTFIYFGVDLPRRHGMVIYMPTLFGAWHSCINLLSESSAQLKSRLPLLPTPSRSARPPGPGSPSAASTLFRLPTEEEGNPHRSRISRLRRRRRAFGARAIAAFPTAGGRLAPMPNCCRPPATSPGCDRARSRPAVRPECCLMGPALILFPVARRCGAHPALRLKAEDFLIFRKRYAQFSLVDRLPRLAISSVKNSASRSRPTFRRTRTLAFY